MKMNVEATTTFEGIVFDAEAGTDGDNQYGFDISANTTFNDCKFQDYTQYDVKILAETTTFDNCIFNGAGVTPSAIIIAGTIAECSIENCEFKNYKDYNISVEDNTTITTLTIDQCVLDGANTESVKTTKAALFTKGIVSTSNIQDSEFKNFAECAITVDKWYGGRFDALTINGCLIHDCTQSAIYLPDAIDTNEKQTCSDFKLTNSTIYNVGDNTKDHGAVDIRDNANIASAQQVLIDHVTIYNFSTKASYGGFMIYKSGNATISNCIAMNPADVYSLWINPFVAYTGATVSNCVNFNCGYVDNGATQSGLVKADPMFVDAANADFMLYAESPAIGMGDPRWGVKAGLQPGAKVLSEAVAAAEAGATITLGDGIYEESSSFDFDKEGLTIVAAEGTKPIIKTTDQWTSLGIVASTTFDGITFDGGNLTKTSLNTKGTAAQTLTLRNCEFKNYTDYNINVAENTTINTITIDNCVFDGVKATKAAILAKGIVTTCTIEDSEFKNYAEYCITANDYYRGRIDGLSINNCLLHDGVVAVYMPKYADEGTTQTCANFTLTNSTIYNMVGTTKWEAVIDIRSNPEAEEALNKVVIDHITLYNFTTTDLGGITSRKSTDVLITNSIIANPADKANQYAYHLYGAAAINNTLTFNTKTSGGTPTDPINDDPLFVNAAENNFQLYANSPAIGAGTDNSNLGDPRWGVSKKIKGKVVNIEPGEQKLNTAIGYSVSAGDTIVLADGIYNEPYGFDFNVEGLVVMAAKGATPVVELSNVDGWTTFTLSASTTFDGIIFDGKAVCKSMLQTNATDISKLAFYNCEFRNYDGYAISNPDAGGTHVDSVIIDNCLFHDGAGSAVNFNNKGYNGNHACSYFKMTNSSVYNIGSSANAAITIRANDDATGAQNKVIIDHITLYNYATSEYGGIAIRKTNDLQITNSIIANPTAGLTAIYHYSEVQNDLFHNVTLKTSDGAAYNATCVIADPLFVDAANGNFKLKGTSPAVYAATDGTHLGDPRWGVEMLEIGDVNDATAIGRYDGKTIDVQVNRTFTANDGWYTLSLPFDLPQAQLSKIGKAYKISEDASKYTYNNGAINVPVEPVNELSACLPYLILPTADIDGFVAEDVKIAYGNGAEADVTIHGISDGNGKNYDFSMTSELYVGGTETTDGSYWVGADGLLYNDNVQKLALRAYFNIAQAGGNGIPPRFRIVADENVETGVGNITSGENTAIKTIENGQLIIIREGVKYNVQGVRL